MEVLDQRMSQLQGMMMQIEQHLTSKQEDPKESDTISVGDDLRDKVLVLGKQVNIPEPNDFVDLTVDNPEQMF